MGMMYTNKQGPGERIFSEGDMNEAEWLVSTDPQAMLACLPTESGPVPTVNRPPWPFKISDRKLRLFACACCRLARGPDDPNAHEVDKYEVEGHWPGVQTDVEWAERWATNGHPANCNPVKAALLREICGNPFRPAEFMLVPFVGNYKQIETVHSIAQGIYADRAFDDMPILADALEDAGCDNADILAHCRGPGPHVRGCWVVDLILGKE